MVPAVHYRTDRADIAFTKDDAWHDVSLTPYLEKSDAVGVVLEAWNEDSVQRSTGCRVAGIETTAIIASGLMHYASHLSGVDNEISLKADGSNVHYGIAAELRGPGVVMHDPVVLIEPADSSEINKWINRSVTLEGADSASDVDSVILLAYTNGTWTSDWGARALGSTTSRLWGHTQYNAQYWLPCATDDGDFQVWIGGKTSPTYQVYLWMWELGYIKKGYGFHGIVDFDDEEPPTATDWTLRAVGSNVPDPATGILAVHYSLPASGYDHDHGLRTPGSSNESGQAPTGKPFDSACPVKLDTQRRYSYLSESSAPEIWPLAYTTIAEASSSLSLALSVAPDPRAMTLASSTLICAGVFVPSPIISVPTQLSAEPEIESVMTGIQTVESVMTAIPEVESVITGRPEIGEE